MKKVVWCLILVVVLVSLLIASCSQQASPTPTTSAAPKTSSAPATQASTQEVIKIGHIRPMTGDMAQTSNLMIRSFNFALEQAGYQVAGKKIEIILGDSQGDAAKALDVARKMVEKDKVAMIVGPTQGGEEMAVASYMNQLGIPVMFTNPEPMGVIAQNMKWVIGAGGTEPQISATMGVYTFEQAGYKKVDILTGDFAPGHGFLNAFMDSYKKKGGTIVQEIYTPVPTQDFAPFMTVLKDADAVVAWHNGEQAIKLLSQYHELGIDKRMPIVGAFHGAFLTPFILKALPPADSEALIGALTPTTYSPLLDTEFNKKFKADFKAKFGADPEDNTDSETYQGAMVLLAALKATNGDTTPDKLRQALVSVNFAGPEGPVKFDPQTGASIKTIYIAKISKQNNLFVLNPVFSYPDVPPAGF